MTNEGVTQLQDFAEKNTLGSTYMSRSVSANVLNFCEGATDKGEDFTHLFIYFYTRDVEVHIRYLIWCIQASTCGKDG